jgi:hypothetical protein
MTRYIGLSTKLLQVMLKKNKKKHSGKTKQASELDSNMTEILELDW